MLNKSHRLLQCLKSQQRQKQSASLSSSSISLPVMLTLTSAIPQPCNASVGPQTAVNDVGDSSAVTAPKPQSLAVKAVNICPYTPSTHLCIGWADDDDEGLPDLDEWNIPLARSLVLCPPVPQSPCACHHCRWFILRSSLPPWCIWPKGGRRSWDHWQRCRRGVWRAGRDHGEVRGPNLWLSWACS